MEAVAKSLTAYIDLSGEIQPNKVEYLHIWRWAFFKKIVDDCEEYSNGLFEQDENWNRFSSEVRKISFSSREKGTLSLSSLSVMIKTNHIPGIDATAQATFEKVSKTEAAFRRFVDIVDQCEVLFSKLKRTDIPYYIFVDEMEAYCGDSDLFKRDLTLIRDLVFTIHKINSYGNVHIIAAIRNEILFAMDRFIQTRELNKISDGYSVPIKWS